MQDKYFYPKIQAFTRVSALKQLVFMTVLHSLEALSQWQHKSGWHHKRGGFVPTMGALHEGHLALIRQAKASSDLVVVSILVNPTQFNDSTDFQAYPRTLETDAALAERAGADAVFAPTPEDLYGGPPSAQPVEWGSLTHSFEGEHRPGHFDGVVAVVDLLFSSVRPKLAVFGEKDLQQVAVVRRLAQERHPDVEVCVGSLVRDENGLALSSRNARLSVGKKAVALELHRRLVKIQEAWRNDSGDVTQALDEARTTLSQHPEIVLEYLDIVDGDTFESIAKSGVRATHAVVAAHVEGVRLIDNVPLRT